jgi:hypothetical protein
VSADARDHVPEEVRAYAERLFAQRGR